MREILVPREIVNDDSVIVVAVKFDSGSSVLKGQCLFEVETSKTVISVESPEDGVVVHDVSVGDEVKVGSLLCRLRTSDPQPIAQQAPAEAEKSEPNRTLPVISRRALERAQQLGVSTSVFTSGFVSSSDVEAEAKKGLEAGSEGQPSFPKRLTNRLVIVGGGGHAKMCIDILRQTKEFQIVGVVDPQKPVGSVVCGVKVIGDDGMLQQLWEEGVSCAVNGIGAVANPMVRKLLFEKLKNIGFLLPNLVHPSAVVEPSVQLGEGNQIMMGACVGSDCVVGDNCIVNSGAIVSHDCVLSDHAHVAPGAVLAGNVQVAETAVVGMGATVYFGLKIGAQAVINNGINVFRDVEPGAVIKA